MATSSNKKSSESGDVALVADQDLILRYIECPSCYEIPMAPIYSCNEGHIICNNCHSRLRNCPLCKSGISKKRNFPVEDIVGSTLFYCNYKGNGCDDLILGELFQSHLAICAYRNGCKVKEGSSTSAKVPQGSRRTNSSNANEESSHTRRIGGCCQWISSSANDQIPLDAVEGGIEHGSRLYIARADHGGGLLPGKLHSRCRRLFFPWGGHECIKYEYEVLVAHPNALRWDTCTNGVLPPNALFAGRNEIGEALYIGRCGYKETLCVGWVLPSQKIIRIIYNEREHTSNLFEVLVKTEAGINIDRQN